MYKPNKGQLRDNTLGTTDCMSQQSTAACPGAGDRQRHRPQPAGTTGSTRARLPATVVAMAVVAGLIGAAPDAAAQAATQTNAQQNAATSFAGQAAQLGIKTCARLFAALGESLSEGAAFASSAHTDKTSQNDHAAQAIVGMKYDTPGYQAQAAGIVFAAPTDSGCEGQLVRVAPFPESCPDVARRLPKGSTLATTLSGTPLFTLGGNQGQALLVPSGNSCVVVTVAGAMERR